MEQKVGISMRQEGNQVIVAKVNPKGLFPNVKIGQILLSVNGCPVSDAKVACDLLKAKSLTIVVKDSNSSSDDCPVKPIKVASLLKGGQDNLSELSQESEAKDQPQNHSQSVKVFEDGQEGEEKDEGPR